MRQALLLVPALLLATAFPASTRAQPTQGANMDPAQCDQLASMPNPPMTAEACRAMMAAAAGMQAAQASPEGQRPGDEALTCEQISAELRTQDVQGPTDEHMAEGQTAGADLRAQTDAARRNARPGAGRNRAQEASLAAAQQRATAASAAELGDMADQMQANPRLARLIALGGEKHCRFSE